MKTLTIHLHSQHSASICLFPLSLQEQRDILHGLRQAAFETESENSLSHERRRSLCAKEFKKLGFSVSDCCRTLFHNVSVHCHHYYQYTVQRYSTSYSYLRITVSIIFFQNNSNPGQDLVRTPPGLLALDTMFYFAARYPDAYSRVSVIYLLFIQQSEEFYF